MTLCAGHVQVRILMIMYKNDTMLGASRVLYTFLEHLSVSSLTSYIVDSNCGCKFSDSAQEQLQ